MPKISVVMPVYNGEKYLRESIDSILNQTYSDFEFIIINDASKDSTEEIIKSYDDVRIVYAKNEQNLGVAGTLNRGLAIAKGEYIARMDADDISMPQRFEKQVKLLDKHKDIGVCGSNIILFGEDITERTFIYSKTDAQIRVDMMFNSAFAHPVVMIRHNILTQNNIKYDISYEKAEDYKMWHDILKYCKGYNFQEPLLKYRYHNAQVTKTHIADKNKSVNKIRDIMYKTIAGNEDCYEVFCDICNGVRNFDDDKYDRFLTMVHHSLKKKDMSYNKRELKRTWSLINYTIYKNSNIKNYKILTLFELAVLIKGVIKK